MELLIDLRGGTGPKRRRLEDELRRAVRGGRLAAGTVLPSTRVLAAELRVSRGVVVEAYAQLVAEGYLSTRSRAATVVAARGLEGAAAPGRLDPVAPALRYDFAVGVPDLSAFPRRAWLAAGARGLREVADSRLGYGDVRGIQELRATLAAYLGRARGVVAAPEQVLVTGGTRQAFGLVWRSLHEAGARRVAVEDPGWPPQRTTLVDAGLVPVPVPVDSDGLRVEMLGRLRVDAVVLTPAHQFPAGGVLAPGRRAALLQWARARDAIVVEDDYDAEYRFDRDPVGALQGMAPDRVVYAGSASKTLAPALRLGWLVLPTALAPAVERLQARNGLGAALPDQLALARFIQSGELDRHLRRTRRRYRARRDALVAAVAAELPAWRIEGIAAGLQAVVRLPEGADEAAVVRAAASRGVGVEGLARFRAGPAEGSAGLVLGYANLPEQAIVRAVAELAGVVSRGRDRPAERGSPRRGPPG